jgi:predicted transposase/invertase (TIGR01784 family)
MSTVYPYTDFLVRYLLGDEENTDLLLSFINAVNENSGLPLIKSVTIKNSFNLIDYQSDKESVLDVKAIDEHGVQYDIEIQAFGNKLFSNRSLYYWAKLYSSQLEKGNQYQQLKPVICINLINFTLIKETSDVHSCFLPIEKNNHDLILTDHFVINFLELPKFFKKEKFNSNLENWMAFFKYEGQEEDIMKTIIKNNPNIAKAHDKYNAFTLNDKYIEMYEARLKWQRQYSSDVTYAEEQGIKKGIIEGKIEGIIEDALAMKKDGLTVEKISLYTGLSIKEIEQS